MLRKLHQWAGLIVSAWLVVCILSGLLLVWADEYYAWRYPQLPDELTTLKPDGVAIGNILSATAEGQDPIRTLGMPSAQRRFFHAYFSSGKEAIYHPVSGQMVAEWTWQDSLPAFFFELHAHLLLGEIGHTSIGILGIAVLVIMLLGSIIWFQRRKIFRLRYFFPRQLNKAYLIRSHAAQGVILLIPVLVLVFSGVAFVFPKPVQNAFHSTLGVVQPIRPTIRQTVHSENQASVTWQAVIDAAEDSFPEARIRFVMPPREPQAPITVRMRNTGELHPNGRTYVVLDPGTTEVLQKIDATKTGLGQTIYNALYPLHAGKTGWPGYRLFLTIVGLLLLNMVIIGAVLMIARLRLHLSS